MPRRKPPKIPPKFLRELWAEIPSIDCQGKCANSCGPIDMSKLERELIEDRTGRTVEALPPSLTCSMLKNGRCTVYSARPVICRLWGVVESMRCPHGCKPERVLSDQEGFTIMGRAMQLGGSPKQGSELVQAINSMPPEMREQFKRYVQSAPDLGGVVIERRI